MVLMFMIMVLKDGMNPMGSFWGFCWGSYGGHMGGCQNYGTVLGTLDCRCRIIVGTQQKKTIILTTTNMGSF